MNMKYALATVLGLFFGSTGAYADTCEVIGTSVCGFLYGVEAVSDTLPITIDSRDILSYKTAFSMSNKDMAIFMPCNAAGRRDCNQAIVDLSILTGTSACQDNFYIALVVGGEAGSEMPMNVLGKDFWLVFAIKRKDGSIAAIRTTFPADTMILDCNSAMNPMRKEIDRKL